MPRVAARSWSVPRTPWGHPDLQGTYSNDDETGTPMERPRELEGKTLADITPAELQKIVKDRNDRFVEGVSGEEFAGGLRPPAHLIFDTFDRKNKRAWLVVDPPDGRIPRRTDATAPRGRAAASARTPTRRVRSTAGSTWGSTIAALRAGFPASMMPAGYGSRYDITQWPDSVVIRYEMIHEARVIPSTRSRGRVRRRRARKYLGDPRGWWEGDTLVVETTNFLPETAPQGATEHVRDDRALHPGGSADIVEWRVTFEDPNTWTRPWTFSMPLTKVDRSQQMFVYSL